MPCMYVCVHVCLCKCLFPNSGSYRVLVVFNAKPQQLFKSPVQSPSIFPFKIPLEFLESSFKTPLKYLHCSFNMPSIFFSNSFKVPLKFL